MRPITLFTVLGVRTTISPAGLAFFAMAAFLLAGLAAVWSGLPLGEALTAGALGGLAMFISEWLHQMGHAVAARRVGYPMVGVHFRSVLAVSEYPAAEPPLPAEVHIRRALGGFWINVLIGLFLAPYAFFLSFRGGAMAWAVGFTAFYNLVVVGLGALLPIDIPNVLTTDGATLRRYWRRRSTDN
jgi:hypothetical protein